MRATHCLAPPSTLTPQPGLALLNSTQNTNLKKCSRPCAGRSRPHATQLRPSSLLASCRNGTPTHTTQKYAQILLATY